MREEKTTKYVFGKTREGWKAVSWDSFAPTETGRTFVQLWSRVKRWGRDNDRVVVIYFRCLSCDDVRPLDPEKPPKAFCPNCIAEKPYLDW